jgi:cyanophycinase-like exopeptidase
MKSTIYLLILFPALAFCQSYTSYFTGSTADISTNPTGGACLMGGASEDDGAMKWFLQRASGGDILVLRANGSDGYNDYFYSDLGVSVNSVETIVFNSASASSEAYIHQKIQQAEAVWFAGGDQWDYVSYWRGTAIDSLINQAIAERNIVIGGTSAGMAILGKYYFSAQNGTVTSGAALSNPYNNNVTVDSAAFLKNGFLGDVVTDTHFDDPDRKGRFTVFLARIFTDYGVAAKGIACDEYTAVCVDENGLAKVFGGHPTYDDNAYFVQTNCELGNMAPESCVPNSPLNWNLGGVALRVLKVKGTPAGTHSFDLNDWETASNGEWLTWSVSNGAFSEQNGNPIDCNALSVGVGEGRAGPSVFPNPATGSIRVKCSLPADSVEVLDELGRKIGVLQWGQSGGEIEANVQYLPPGKYFLAIKTAGGERMNLVFIKK